MILFLDLRPIEGLRKFERTSWRKTSPSAKLSDLAALHCFILDGISDQNRVVLTSQVLTTLNSQCIQSSTTSAPSCISTDLSFSLCLFESNASSQPIPILRRRYLSPIKSLCVALKTAPFAITVELLNIILAGLVYWNLVYSRAFTRRNYLYWITHQWATIDGLGKCLSQHPQCIRTGTESTHEEYVLLYVSLIKDDAFK